MDIDEIFEKVKNKELTICESCDNIFNYVPQKIHCDECRNAKARKYREENRDKINAYARKYREENREKIATKKRKHREENRERLLARERKYYEKNREKINARRRESRRAKKKEE